MIHKIKVTVFEKFRVTGVVTVLMLSGLSAEALCRPQGDTLIHTRSGFPVRIIDEQVVMYRDGEPVMVSVSFDQVPLSEALRILVEKAGLGISYRSDDICLQDTVSLEMQDVPFHQVLNALLENVDVESFLTPGRDVLVIRKTETADEQPPDRKEQKKRGIISGVVIDAAMEESLQGANVIIEGTNIGTSTDVDGRFTLRNVPLGEQVLWVGYMGFEQKRRTVEPEDSDHIKLKLELEPVLLEGDEVFVHSFQRGQARALTLQRQSLNIRNVISAEQMDRFADPTVERALRRIPGMGHEGAGVNIRGIGSAMSNVKMDGQRMGTTGSGRSFDLSTISADMVQQLNVIKVVTPDMDADALAGVIDIKTRRSTGGTQTLNIRAGGGAQPRYAKHTGPNTRFSFSYGDSPEDHYSYAVNFSYQRQPDAEEAIRYTWGEANIRPWGPIDVLAGLDSRYEFGSRDRYGVGGQFTYQPTSRSTYHLQGTFIYQDRNEQRHTWSQQPRIENMTNPWQTGPVSSSLYSTFGYSVRDMHIDIHQYTVQASGRHLFDRFDLEYRLGWGHGRRHRDSWEYNWSSGYPGWDMLIDIEDRWHPIIDVAPWGPISSYPHSDQLPARGATPDHDIRLHRDNELSTGIDLVGEHRFGNMKFGGSTVSTFQQGESERFYMEYDGRTGPLDFPQRINHQWSVFGREHSTYTIPYMIDVDEARQLYYARYPSLRKDLGRHALRQTDWYDAQEHILALYGMTVLQLDFVTLLLGARLEHERAQYTGREVIIRTRQSRSIVNLKTEKQFTHLFPNAQAVIHLTDRTNFRMAYSRTIGRPGLYRLVPYKDWNFDWERVAHGNPDLRPMVSDNFDIMIDHYFMNVGHISAGVFYKILDDFAFTVSDRIPVSGLQDIDPPPGYEPEQFAGWDRRTYLNGDEATVYGFEASWQQNLTFLPGFLGGLGTYFTYSYTYSEADIDRAGPDGETIYVRLEDQRPHVINAGLDYSRGRFSGQVSYHWSEPAVLSYASTPRYAPAFREERVYFDSYHDSARDLSITLRYRITDSFRVWIDGSNMLNQKSVSYQLDRDMYPATMSLSGRRLNIGLKYTL